MFEFSEFIIILEHSTVCHTAYSNAFGSLAATFKRKAFLLTANIASFMIVLFRIFINIAPDDPDIFTQLAPSPLPRLILSRKSSANYAPRAQINGTFSNPLIRYNPRIRGNYRKPVDAISYPALFISGGRFASL